MRRVRPAEWDRLTDLLVDKGTFVRLDRKPNSFRCVSDPEDVAPGRGQDVHLFPVARRCRSDEQLDGPPSI